MESVSSSSITSTNVSPSSAIHKEMTFSTIKKNGDESFLTLLNYMKAFFKQGTFQYMDNHEDETKFISQVVIVCSFSKNDKLIETWVSPLHYDCNTQSVNPFLLKKNESGEIEIQLSVKANEVLSMEEMSHLKTFDTLMKDSDYRKNRYTAFSVNDLKRLL